MVILGLLVFAVGVANAQVKGFTFSSWTQVGAISLDSDNDFKSLELAVAPGYAFNSSLFVRLQADLSVGMWDRGSDNKTYRTNGTLGPSFGWNIIKDREGSNFGILDVVATVGNTLENKDWSYTFYDLGFDWTLSSRDKSRAATRWLIGLGVRYYDSHNSRFDNSCNLYAKIGFRFN